jgi:hypothetical protein
MAKLITLTGASIALAGNFTKIRMESHKDTGHLRIRPTDRVVSKDLSELTRSGEGDDLAITAVIPGRYFEAAEAKNVLYPDGTYFAVKNANQWLEIVATKPAEGEVLGEVELTDTDEPVVPEKPKRGRKPAEKTAETTEAPVGEAEKAEGAETAEAEAEAGEESEASSEAAAEA